MGVIPVRVSVAVGALTFYPVATTLSFAGAAGADGVELLVDPRMLARGSERYARMALERGVPIFSVHSVLHIRRRSIGQTIHDDAESIRFAAQIPTCETVVLHPPLTGSRPSPQLNEWLEAMSHARAESANPALRLGLENRGENYDGAKAQFLDDFGRLRRLAEEWDFSITLDVAHAASHGVDVITAAETCMPRLANVHVSDAKARSYRGGVRNGLFRDHQLPGEGKLPLGEFVAALQLGRYHGPITIELSPLSLRAFWPPAAKRRMRQANLSVQAMVSTVRTPIDLRRSFPRPSVSRREETHEDA